MGTPDLVGLKWECAPLAVHSCLITEPLLHHFLILGDRVTLVFSETFWGERTSEFLEVWRPSVEGEMFIHMHFVALESSLRRLSRWICLVLLDLVKPPHYPELDLIPRLGGNGPVVSAVRAPMLVSVLKAPMLTSVACSTAASCWCGSLGRGRPGCLGVPSSVQCLACASYFRSAQNIFGQMCVLLADTCFLYNFNGHCSKVKEDETSKILSIVFTKNFLLLLAE